jgi:hypothetical protein
MNLKSLPILATLLLLGLGQALESQPKPRWWKGNTHTHTLWSDGNALPDLAVAWYKDRGYHFLALTDHNILQDGETWFPVATAGGARLQPEQVEMVLKAKDPILETRTREGQPEARLSRHDELVQRFSQPGEFLLIPGEEITSNWRSPGPEGRGHPVHINAIGLEKFIPPARGSSVVDVLNQVFDGIAAQQKDQESPVLGHLNHPNFGWGVNWEDMAQIRKGVFFEVYNGHTGTADAGNALHLSTDEMWDRANIRRLTELKLPLLLGVSTDDTHHYHGGKVAGPGRGWIVVRAETLTMEALAKAMRAGDFYSTSGVEISDISVSASSYQVQAKARPGETLTIEFLGARKSQGEQAPEPQVLATSQAEQATYEFQGDELFVRTRITSSLAHSAPKVKGELQRAWTQPIQPGK